ncbi:ankyrin repeat-containing domain protein [Mycena galopus ATCC 62051]|nr:ankyrin repeat-containing domain protein [Mycena galopus ATCC 62051]
MSRAYFDSLPPELVLKLCPLLPVTSLNALTLTCRRLHQILQADLDSLITPRLARELLMWAAASKPHIIRKLLSRPYSMHPDHLREHLFWPQTPLHVATKAGNIEITRLLLEAGASPAAQWSRNQYQPLHLAMLNKDLDMMNLLLDYGAPIDSAFMWDGPTESLHYACWIGHLDTIKLLLDRGADFERRGEYGTALGFAVHGYRMDIVRFLLDQGADATVAMTLQENARYPPLFPAQQTSCPLDRVPIRRPRRHAIRSGNAPQIQGTAAEVLPSSH